MRPVIRRRGILIGVALIVAAASLLVAYAHAGSAPATTRRAAPVWLSTADTTLSGRSLTVYGGIEAKADLAGAVVSLYKREVGQNADTLVGKATVTYSAQTGNVFHAAIPHLKRSCVITAFWDGNASFFAGRTWMFAGVKPRLTVTVPVATQTKTKVRIVFSPDQPFHQQPLTAPPTLADVQCRVAGVWTHFPGEVSVFGTNGKTWCTYDYANVPAGTYTIRASFVGTNYNVASVSKAMEIVIP
jgi:hypothetical protein